MRRYNYILFEFTTPVDYQIWCRYKLILFCRSIDQKESNSARLSSLSPNSIALFTIFIDATVKRLSEISLRTNPPANLYRLRPFCVFHSRLGIHKI